MSQSIYEALRFYNELESSDPESELLAVKTDLDRALEFAPLDEEERALIVYLYLTEPVEHPIRGRPDKNGGQSGRPPGGMTQGVVAKLILEERSENAMNIRASRILKRAVSKLATFLGEGYG